MPRPVHFEIPTDNPEKAIQFYEKTFGWKFQKWDGPVEYWTISTGEGPGIDGGLLRRRDPQQPPCNTISVPDLDKYGADIEANGGTCCLPKMAIPGIGWLAYYKDLDGHIFGIMQSDPSAK
ncbi:MAG: VOC family protein [Candidatus Obscuribacterales bacterium]